eukprot:c33810_g1_i1.p1 GENE.c33810_g1_i1~~c33810_g1_i1.p1  ORF type:complete len:131 (+),score=47.03 c33810_g1_i1:44-436(+)
MVVRLRLARFGRKNLPKYRVTAADSRCRRDGRHLEVVGSYDPFPDKNGIKHVQFNIERVKYWIACGAQPSDRVRKLLGMAGILPPAPLGFLHNRPLSKTPNQTPVTSSTKTSSETIQTVVETLDEPKPQN